MVIFSSLSRYCIWGSFPVVFYIVSASPRYLPLLQLHLMRLPGRGTISVDAHHSREFKSQRRVLLITMPKFSLGYREILCNQRCVYLFGDHQHNRPSSVWASKAAGPFQAKYKQGQALPTFLNWLTEIYISHVDPSFSLRFYSPFFLWKLSVIFCESKSNG